MPTVLGTRTKRVAMVDASSTGGLLPGVLDRYDIECVHVRSPRPDAVLSYASDGFIDDIRHFGDIEATASVLRQHEVGHVIAGQAAGVELAGRLAAALGAPGNGTSRPTARRDRYEMTLAVREAGLAHASGPVSADADAFFVNTVSRAGSHHTADIWRRHRTRLPGGCRVPDCDEPLAPDDPVARELESYTHQVLDALDVRNGAAHTEVVRTADGPALVDSAACMGAGQVLDISNRCFGSNQVELLALSLAKPEEFDRLPTTAYRLLEHQRRVHLINPRQDGVVPSYEAMAAVRGLASHVFTVMRHSEGKPIPPTTDAATQPGSVFLVSEDPVQLRADYGRLREIERDRLYANHPRQSPAASNRSA